MKDDCQSTSSSFQRHCCIIRHHIGRLSSWVQIPRNLTTMSKDYHKILLDMRLRSIRPLRPARYFRDPHRPSRSAAVSQRGSPLSQRKNARTETRKRSIVHAEVAIMHHLYVNDLESWDKDGYIGCSKRSCSTCELYSRFHPRTWSLRASHGNVWPKWSFPEEDEFSQVRLDNVNIEIMRKINTHMEQDIRFREEKGIASRKYFFESSTGNTRTQSSGTH